MTTISGSLATQTAHERFEGGRVKGTIIRAHVDWVRETASREDTIEFFEHLPADVRRAATHTLASAWYPFEMLIAIDRAIAGFFGGGRPSFLEELGRRSAQRNLSTVTTLLEGTDPHLFFYRTALLHRQFQDFGTAAYQTASPSSGVMVHAGYTSYSPLYCASAMGFYAEALRMHGRSDARVSEETCQCFGDAACRFQLSWR
jgi:hypothetical protein